MCNSSRPGTLVLGVWMYFIYTPGRVFCIQMSARGGRDRCVRNALLLQEEMMLVLQTEEGRRDEIRNCICDARGWC